MSQRLSRANVRAGEWYGDLTAWLKANAQSNTEQILRLKRNLQLAREELTPRQQQLLSLAFEQNMRVSDIARELGLSSSSVSRTLSRAKLHLYHRLRYTF